MADRVSIIEAMAVGNLDKRRRTGLVFIPETILGWSAVGLAVAAPAFYGLAMLAVAAGLETTDFAPPVVIPLLLFALSGLAALIVGAGCVVSGHDRSVLVTASTVVGLIAVALVGWSLSTAFTNQPRFGPPGPPPSGP